MCMQVSLCEFDRYLMRFHTEFVFYFVTFNYLSHKNSTDTMTINASKTLFHLQSYTTNATTDNAKPCTTKSCKNTNK